MGSHQQHITIIINGQAPREQKMIASEPNEVAGTSPFYPDEELGEIIKQKPDITYNNNRTYPDGKKAPDGIEVRFGTTRPTEEVRELLKKHGFRFSERQLLWYAKDTRTSRELAEKLAHTEVDVDTTQYEKRSFWTKVSSYPAYAQLRPKTDFLVKAEVGRYFYSKGYLQSAYPSVQQLIDAGQLYFKKHYNKVIEETEATESELPGDEHNEDSSAIAARLQTLADRMTKQIDDKLHSAISRQRPTARRMRIAQSMREDGYRLLDIQKVLYALAEAHRHETITEYGYLINIRTRAHVELLNQYSHAIKDNWSQDSIARLFDINKATLEQLGIHDVREWDLANTQKQQLLQTYAPSVPDTVRNEQQDKIRQLEMEVARQLIPGFFPTPRPLIERMLDLADLRPEHTILEPSAGKGDILDAIADRFPRNNPRLYAVEPNSLLRDILTLKGYTLRGTDFLKVNTSFDRIIMNPPFENGQDIAHVMHALQLLQPGGRVVAIMSEGVFFRQFKKDVAFRQLLQQKDAYVSEPIKDAFKNAFNTTGVTVRIVAINEDGSLIEMPAIPGTTVNEQNADEIALLELEAEAELELLKMRLELERKAKGRSLEGAVTVTDQQLQQFRKRAWEMQDSWKVLDFN